MSASSPPCPALVEGACPEPVEGACAKGRDGERRALGRDESGRPLPERAGQPLGWEMFLFALLLVTFNVPLLQGQFSTSFSFHPGTVQSGEWWRLLTYPWPHVSWYHLALDAAAFFFAYAELKYWRVLERLGCVAAAAAGSLVTALLWSPAVYLHGLCGLSGIAHGLTAVASLQAATREEGRLLRTLGWVGFGGTVLKCIIEVLTGHVLFASWHLGWLGTPIAGAHLGGVLGALVVWWRVSKSAN